MVTDGFWCLSSSKITIVNINPQCEANNCTTFIDQLGLNQCSLASGIFSSGSRFFPLNMIIFWMIYWYPNGYGHNLKATNSFRIQWQQNQQKSDESWSLLGAFVFDSGNIAVTSQKAHGFPSSLITRTGVTSEPLSPLCWSSEVWGAPEQLFRATWLQEEPFRCLGGSWPTNRSAAAAVMLATPRGITNQAWAASSEIIGIEW